MTVQELRDYNEKLSWLSTEQSAQWTAEVREAWLAMRKAYKAWEQSGTAPDFTCGSIKNEGELTPLFIVNETYEKYHALKTSWNTKFEPQYIKDNRARLSLGDFVEDENDK